MRNHPILAAALLAAAVSAQAQSGVSLYGTLDVAAGRFQGLASGVNALDKALYKVDSGGMSTSHIGVRGSEDLGGGWSAAFELSSFLRNDTGAPGRSDAIGAPVNVAADPFWARAAWVGVSSSSAGRVRLGNVTTLLFLNAITSNAFGDSTVFAPLNLVTFIGGPQAGGTAWTNSLVYDSPVWSGLSFSIARSLAETQGGRNTSARVAFAQGPWVASFAWQDVRKNPLTFADGTTSNNTRSWQLAASYDWRVVKLFGHVGRIVNDGTEAAPLDLAYRLWELSASLPVGGGRVLAGVAQRRTGGTPAPVPATAAGGNVERRVATLGYDHDLSRRTDLYAVVLSDKTKTRTLPTPPTLVSASGTSYGVGVRHRF